MKVLGLAALQLLFLGAGLCTLTAARRWSTWADACRMLGVAYLLGVSTVGVAATLVLVAGFGLDVPSVVVLALLLAAASAGIARLRGHGLPHGGGFRRPQRDPASLFAAASAGLTLAILALFLRASWGQGLTAWDAWAFWTPKAKAIYFFGGLDEQLFRSLFAPSYPLLVPALQAMDFHFAGAADAAMISLQYWVLLVAFIVAVWALLRRLVPGFVIWPFLLLASLMPELDARFTNGQADWPLDVFFAVAAVCLARWIVTREPWLLASFGVFLSASLAIKREGQLLAACIVVGALVATWSRLRWAWPRILGVAALAYAPNVPWRFWWMSRHLLGDTPPVGLTQLPDYADRAGPALRIVLRLMFTYDMWLVAVPLALAAALVLVLHGSFRLPAFYITSVALMAAGFTWILWTYPSFPLDTSGREPIPRAMGAVALLSCVIAPVLISRVLHETADELAAGATSMGAGSGSAAMLVAPAAAR